MVILVDMDGTVCDFVKVVLDAYNKDYNDTLTAEDIDYHGMHENVKPECGRKIYNYFHAEGTFRDCELYPGAKEGIYALERMGHSIYFVTKPVDHSLYCMWEKQSWVDKHFPSIGHKKVIFTGQKHMIRGDVLIDDLPDNLRDFPDHRILVSQPWNKEADVTKPWMKRVDSWGAILKHIDGINKAMLD